jgi:hypothetical protein
MDMGSYTDAKIAKWQEQAGIRPARGELAKVLCELSDAAFELIKVIECERSGIRDGDGFWSGSDAMGGTADDVIELCLRLRDLRSEPRETPSSLKELADAAF